MHRNSLFAFEQHLLPLISDGDDVLEIGCTAKADHYRQAALKAGRQARWHAADAFAPEGGTPADMPRVPMRDEYTIVRNWDFDVVLAGQVIEHVRKPWLWLPELARVTKPGGLVLLISPISWGHHRAPVDCWRIWPDGMRALCEEAGLAPELLLTVHLDRDTSRERSGQINQGPVLDLVTAARKPGGPAQPKQ